MINIGCLSIFHFGCSVKVTKDQDGVIYQIFTVVDINQKEIIIVKLIEFKQYIYLIIDKIC